MGNASSAQRRRSVIGAKAGFVAVAVALVALVGLMGLYAAPEPLAHAVVDGAAIARAAASSTPDAAFAALTPRLEPQVAAALAAPDPAVQRAAHAQAVLADLAHREAMAMAARLRLLLGIVTLLAIGLGIGVAGAGQGAPSPGRDPGTAGRAASDRVE